MKCRYKFSIIIAAALAVLLIPGTSAFALYQEVVEEEMTEEEYQAYTEQYEAYTAATEEQDLLKRGDMLLEFLEKYPKSKDFESYVLQAYETLLYTCSNEAKYQELETLSEKWLVLFPDNLQIIGLAASAAIQLNHNEKSLKYLLIIYESEPTVDRALAVAQLYDKMGNFEKYVEWCEIIFTYPEYSVDYTLRYDLMERYLKKEDIEKASPYAAKILEVISTAEQPDAAGREKMRKISRFCHHIISIQLYGQEKYKEAIKSFDKALKSEQYQEGYYYTGQCYWRLMDPETAHDWFAAAEIVGGELTQKAKEYKEELYKPLHNDSLFGIEKVHKRAQAIIDSYSKPKKKLNSPS